MLLIHNSVADTSNSDGPCLCVSSPETSNASDASMDGVTTQCHA